MRKFLVSSAVAGVIILASSSAWAEAAKPPKPFVICAVCHSTEKDGPKKLGPDLFGVVGRKAGTLPGFNYSKPMKDSGLTWTPQELDTYLAAPQKVVPGTIMAFPGLRNPKQRQEIIDYLKTLK